MAETKDRDSLEHEKFGGEGAVKTQKPPLTWRAEYDGSGNTIYLGYALPGTAESAASWQIRKYTYVAGGPSGCLWADGNELYDNVWTNRASLTYA